MSQQMMDADVAVIRLYGQPGQVTNNGLPNLQPSLVLQLQYNQRRKGLGDGPDLEAMCRRYRRLAFEIGESVAGSRRRILTIRKSQR
jgi:hypothetical protein